MTCDLTPNPSPKERGSLNKKRSFQNRLTPGYITAKPTSYIAIKSVRANMKRNPTKPEKLLWLKLRNKKLGYKFRRQHIIDRFYVDFICLEKKFVVEVDGNIHLTKTEYDQDRTNILNNLGYQIIRFSNTEVINNIQTVVQKIKDIIQDLPSYKDFS